MSRLPQPGDTWNDRYEITAELGRGGFGRVYRAWDPLLERNVAIKMLRLSDDFSPTDQQRFRRETNIAASLDHRHIVTVFDGGEHGGVLYLVMRFVAGHDLRRELEGGPLDVARAVSIARQVGGALDYAHGRGLVHRDVKPGNILCQRASDAVYLADFGISRHIDQTTGDAVTQGLAPATVAYAAPEQMQTSARVDGRADQYALGCLLYESLTGRKPFDGEIAALITAHLHEAPPRVTDLRADLPVGWDDIIVTAMAKDPADRFRRCADLAAEAAALLPPSARDAGPVTADMPPPVPDTPHGARPRPRGASPRGTPGRTRRLDDEAPTTAVRPGGATGAGATGAGAADRPRSRPPGGDPPPVERPRRRAAGGRWRSVGIASGALLVVALLAWTAWPGVGPGSGGATDSDAAADNGGGNPALDEAQRDVLTDAGVGGAFSESDCEPPTRDPLAGQQVAVACASDDQTPTRVVLRRFGSTAERDAALDALGSATSGGDCRTDPRAAHTYVGDAGEGRVVCAVDSAQAGLSWSVPDHPIMGSARLDDPSAADDLYAWWDDLVGRR